MYSPGVIAALLIVLPFSFYLFRRAVAENILTVPQFWMMLGIAPFAVAGIALLSLQLARVFDKKPA